jgi:hypothetical protein
VSVENPQYAEFLRRIIRAMGRRAADDPESLRAFVDLSRDLDVAFVAAARACHDTGYSWADIARPLGITRQAALKRFGAEETP